MYIYNLVFIQSFIKVYAKSTAGDAPHTTLACKILNILTLIMRT